jgi:Bacterial Ig-like domain
MKPRYFFFISAVIILAIIILFFFLFKKNEQKLPGPLPTPTPVSVNQQKNGFAVQTTFPPNGTKQTSLQQTVTLSANQPVTTNDFVLEMQPNFPHTLDAQGTTITIKPTQQLQPGTTYSYRIRYKDGTFSDWYSFTTVGNPPTGTPPAQDNIPQLEDQWDRISQPDVFLYNQIPYKQAYETADFSVTGDFSSTQNGHIFFTVTVKTAQGKQAFLNWVKSTGLTDQQIPNLDIRYQ